MPPTSPPKSKRFTFLLLALGLLWSPTASAKQVRVATFNILQGVDAPGTAEYNAIRDILARVDADVIAFQELRTTTLGNWQALATELGYSSSPYSASTTMSGGLYVGYFSRWPILSTHNVLSPPGANEITRPPFRAVIDVPGTAAPLALWTVHLKAAGGSTNEFRRAVEGIRAGNDIDAYLDANPGHTEYIVLGDFNADVNQSQTTQITSLPGGLPSSYSLGSDISFPIPYAVFPRDAFEVAGSGMVMLDAFHEDSATENTFIGSSGRLDYIFVSSALASNAGGVAVAEVYNSVRDDGIGGLTKTGDPLDPGISSAASDHYLVFADMHMADAPSLHVTPETGIALEGVVNRPMPVTNWTYAVSNAAVDPATWALDLPAWLDTGDTNGVLAPGAVTNLVFTPDTAAISGLVHGVYVDAWTLHDLSTGGEETRPATLTLHPERLLRVTPGGGYVAFGPEGGPFTPTGWTCRVINDGGIAFPWTAWTNADWISVTPSGGILPAFGTTEVAIALGPGVADLPADLYLAPFGFSNVVDGAGNTNLTAALFVTEAGGLVETFESGAPDWMAEGLWHLADTATSVCARAWSGTRAWWFGNEATCTYDTGDAVRGALISPWFVVPSDGRLGFRSWEQTENAETTYDRRTVSVIANGGTTTNLLLVSTNNASDWRLVSLDLSAYAGQTIRVRFAFDSVDPVFNGFEGWFIDNVLVAPPGALAMPTVPARWAGHEGGPFALESGQVSLTLSNAALLGDAYWTVIDAPSWIDTAPSEGVLSPATSTGIMLSLTSLGNDLPGSLYSDTVVLANQMNPANRIEIPVSLLIRDGVDGDWRTVHFGHPEPDGADLSRAIDDADGDGDNNLAEYIADTDPTDSNDYFRVSTGDGAEPYTVKWSSSTGRVYDVEYTETPNGDWQPLMTDLTGFGGTITVHNPGTMTQRLYRVWVRLP